MEAAKSSDLLFWAACYSLHVQWSPDGSHAWDIAADALGSKVSIRVYGRVTSRYLRLQAENTCWLSRPAALRRARAASIL